jgi:hypothetical protein
VSERAQQIGGLPMSATQIVDGVEVRHRLTVRRSIASKCEANASPTRQTSDEGYGRWE